MIVRSQYPTVGYNGLTIIMSNPSRFDVDKGELLSANAGIYFLNTCCKGILPAMCHITYVEQMLTDFLPKTKVVLLLGQLALDEFCKKRRQLIDQSIRLDQQRGSPILDKETGIIYIASYLPQDSFDYKGEYEQKNNTYLQASHSFDDDGDNEEDESEQDTKSTKGRTKRRNYRFWLEADTQKVIGLLAGRLTLPTEDFPLDIYPEAETVIQELKTIKNENFYFDIETDSARNITCFGFSFGSRITYVVPLLRWDYTPAYTCIPEILVALAIALRDNICIGHNISGFDLLVIAYDYGIPFGKNNYDTMLAHHRLRPEVEKSLGHVISLYTCLPYHKNEGVFMPNNVMQERDLWLYNGKDVYTLKLVKAGLDKEAARIRAEGSIAQVNSSIPVYLVMTLQGIRYSQEKLEAVMTNNDKRMTAILKIIDYLVGYTMLPTSSAQCVKYFHDALGLPVVGRTKNKNKLGAYNASLDEKNLLKLYTKNEHPMIPLCIHYRQKSKESGALKFTPWVEDEKVIETEVIITPT